MDQQQNNTHSSRTSGISTWRSRSLWRPFSNVEHPNQVSRPSTLWQPQLDIHGPEVVDLTDDRLSMTLPDGSPIFWNPFPIRNKAELDVAEGILSRSEEKEQLLVSLNWLENLIANLTNVELSLSHPQTNFLVMQGDNGTDPQILLRRWIHPEAVAHVTWWGKGRMTAALDLHLFRALLSKLLYSPTHWLIPFLTSFLCSLPIAVSWPFSVDEVQLIITTFLIRARQQNWTKRNWNCKSV